MRIRREKGTAPLLSHVRTSLQAWRASNDGEFPKTQARAETGQLRGTNGGVFRRVEQQSRFS